MARVRNKNFIEISVEAVICDNTVGALAPVKTAVDCIRCAMEGTYLVIK